jgi:hypothetical protein
MTRLSHSQNLRLLPTLGLAVLLLSSGCSDPGGTSPSGRVTYDRVEVFDSDRVPTADNPLDAIWDQAAAGSITVGDSTTGYPDDFGRKTVVLKAIKSRDSVLFVRAEWLDTLRSVSPHVASRTRFILRIDTTVAGTDTTMDTIYRYSWTRSQTDQDRLAIFWDFGDNGAERADCKSMCHDAANAEGNRMYATGGGHVDVWHWQSGTSDPLFLASDEYWDGTGPHLDEGDSLALDNFDTLTALPRYCHRDSTGYVFDGRIQPFLYDTDTIPYRESMDFAFGYLMPGFILNRNPAPGSAGDVRAYSVYAKGASLAGRWIVVLSRPLTTGHPDDADFAAIPRGDSIMATIAVMDNAGALHSGSKPIYIIFP